MGGPRGIVRILVVHHDEILEIIAGREHLATAQRHPHIAGTNLTYNANNWYQLNINFSANTSRPF